MRENKIHRSQTIPAASISNARYSLTGIRVTKIPHRHQSLINQVKFFQNYLYNNLHKSSYYRVIIDQRNADDLKVSFIQPFGHQIGIYL